MKRGGPTGGITAFVRISLSEHPSDFTQPPAHFLGDGAEHSQLNAAKAAADAAGQVEMIAGRPMAKRALPVIAWLKGGNNSPAFLPTIVAPNFLAYAERPSRTPQLPPSAMARSL
jgi:hypothetical protein